MAPECGHQDEMSRCTWPSAWHTGGLLLLSFPPPPISWHISGTGCSHYSNLLGVLGLSSQHASFQRGLSPRVRLGRQWWAQGPMGPGDRGQGHDEGQRDFVTVPQRLRSSSSMSSSFILLPTRSRCVSILQMVKLR